MPGKPAETDAGRGVAGNGKPRLPSEFALDQRQDLIDEPFQAVQVGRRLLMDRTDEQHAPPLGKRAWSWGQRAHMADHAHIVPAEPAQDVRFTFADRDNALADVGIREFGCHGRVEVVRPCPAQHLPTDIAQRRDRLGIEHDERCGCRTRIQHMPDPVEVVCARDPDHVEIARALGKEIAQAGDVPVVHHLHRVRHVVIDGSYARAACPERKNRHLVAERRHRPDDVVRADEPRPDAAQRDGVLDEQDPPRMIRPGEAGTGQGAGIPDGLVLQVAGMLLCERHTVAGDLRCHGVDILRAAILVVHDNDRRVVQDIIAGLRDTHAQIRILVICGREAVIESRRGCATDRHAAARRPPSNNRPAGQS